MKLNARDPKPPAERGHWWGNITPLGTWGFTDSIASMGSVAAPFLAGFSLTISVIILTSLKPDTARWPDQALLLFVLAAFMLISAVQVTFLARYYSVTPKDLMDWYPDWEQEYRRTQLSDILKTQGEKFRHRANIARWLYSAGLLLLTSGLTILAVPPHVDCASNWRWGAVAAGCVMTGVEFGWAVWALRPRR
ncbi:hypothetical protein ACWDRR_25910 [Kitasatospora sp. NPDC003701]